jgi:hypothetical protein
MWPIAHLDGLGFLAAPGLFALPFVSHRASSLVRFISSGCAIPYFGALPEAAVLLDA